MKHYPEILRVAARMDVLRAINDIRRFTHPAAMDGTSETFNANMRAAALSVNWLRAAWVCYRLGADQGGKR